MASARDILYATRARRAGARYSLRIILESLDAGIPRSAGFALVQKETNFRNVFGHDPVRSIPISWRGTTVTKDKYLTYKRNRQNGLGMQGVGPTQLTWYTFQDDADRLGGCWVPKHNIRVGIHHFASLYKGFRRSHSQRNALRLAAQNYNGTGSAAVSYGWDFLRQYDRWHRILTRS